MRQYGRRSLQSLFGQAPVYEYEPPRELMQFLSELPKRAKRTAIEVAGLAGLFFTLSLLLANSSGDLKDYRAYFLSSCRDVSLVLVGAVATHRMLSGKGKDENN